MDLKKAGIALVNLPQLSNLMSGHSVDEPEVVAWLESASAGIVDFEGYLKNSAGTQETAEQRDTRMRQYEAYDGNIDGLVSCLKSFDVTLNSLTKWEVLIKTYNTINPITNILRGIQPVSEPEPVSTDADGSSGSTESSMAEVVQEHKVEQTVVSSGNHEEEKRVVNNKSTSKKKEEVVPPITPAPDDFMNPPAEPTITSVESTADTSTKETATTSTVEKTEAHANDEKLVARRTHKVPSSTGQKVSTEKVENVQPSTKVPVSTAQVEKSTQAVETVAPMGAVSISREKEKDGGKNFMAAAGTSRINALANKQRAGAQQARGVGKTGTSSKVEVTSQYSKPAQATLEASYPERVAWTDSHIVYKAIINAEPQALRIPEGSVGVLALDGNGANVVSKLAGAFAKVTGTPSADLDNAVLDKVHPDDRLKAKEVLSLLKEMSNSPNAEYPICVPKPSYAIKGVMFSDGVPVSIEALSDLMFTHSLGWVVTPGCIQNSHAIMNADGGATFKLDVAKVKPKKKTVAPTAGDANQAGVTFKRVIQIANRAEFLDDPSNIVIVYPTNRNVGPEGMKNVRVKAAIVKEDGSYMPASFRYQADTRDEWVEKDGVSQKVTKIVWKTFSVTLATKAFVTVTTPSAEFASLTPEEIAKFGSAVSQKSNGKSREVIDSSNVEAVKKYMNTSGITKALALAAAGAIKVEGSELEGLVQSVKAAGDNAATQKAANIASDAVEDMGGAAPEAAPAPAPEAPAPEAAPAPAPEATGKKAGKAAPKTGTAAGDGVDPDMQ